MQNIKKQLVEIIISEIDENQNESITFDEFVLIFLNYNKDRMPQYADRDNKDIIRELKKILQENLGFDNWMYSTEWVTHPLNSWMYTH